MILRILAWVGAALVFLVGLLLSLGAALAAPLGIWLVRRRARRRARQPNAIAVLFGGVLASAMFAAVVWAAVFLLIPKPSQKEMQTAVAQGQSRPLKMPDWYNKMFPQAAQYDSASERVMESPGFMRLSLVFMGVFIAVFCGAIGGAAAWVADRLLRVGRAAPPAVA